MPKHINRMMEKKILNEWHAEWEQSEQMNTCSTWVSTRGGLLLESAYIDEDAHAEDAPDVFLGHYGNTPVGRQAQAKRWVEEDQGENAELEESFLTLAERKQQESPERAAAFRDTISEYFTYNGRQDMPTVLEGRLLENPRLAAAYIAGMAAGEAPQSNDHNDGHTNDRYHTNDTYHTNVDFRTLYGKKSQPVCHESEQQPVDDQLAAQNEATLKKESNESVQITEDWNNLREYSDSDLSELLQNIEQEWDELQKDPKFIAAWDQQQFDDSDFSSP